jgi:hypothetical protein
MTAVQESLTDLLDALSTGPEAWRVKERERIVAAMAVDSATHGTIDPNRVRRLLTNPRTGLLDVNPSVLSSTYSSLRTRKVITRVGWVESDDSHGKNGGKRLGLWAWTDELS